MNPKNNGICQAYLSEFHQIPLADALKMLKAMNAKEQHKTFNSANLAKVEKRKKARAEYLANNPDHVKNTQPAQKKSVIAPKAQEPFTKPVPRPQKPDESAITGSKLYSLMIPLEDIERLKRAAKDNEQSVSMLIRAAIKNHLIHYP
jgi:hypothetical protein